MILEGIIRAALCKVKAERVILTKSLYKTDLLQDGGKKYKSFTRFFSYEGCPPPVCLRCSPGLFRHGGGAASCHTSSMVAKPHLALTQNSSPTTLANGRRTAQIAGTRGRAPVARRSGRNTRPSQRTKHPRRARREISSRPKRHPQMAQSPRQSRKAAVPTPKWVADGGLMLRVEELHSTIVFVM